MLNFSVSLKVMKIQTVSEGLRNDPRSQALLAGEVARPGCRRRAAGSGVHTDARRGRASRLPGGYPDLHLPSASRSTPVPPGAQPSSLPHRPEPSSPTGRAPRAGLLVARLPPGRRACCRAALWGKSLPALDGCPHAPPVLTRSDPFLSRDGVESGKRRPRAASHDKPPLPGSEQETRPLPSPGPWLRRRPPSPKSTSSGSREA